MLNKLYSSASRRPKRDDLVAVLGTGIPKVTYTGTTFADELRINLVDPADRGARTGWASWAATTPASRTAAG